jgi:hypothetical protein
MSAPQDQTAYLLGEKVAELSAALLARHPKMPTLLREIHQTLSKYPEQVTLMSEEDIRAVVEGLKIQTGVEFAATVTKPSGSKSLAAKIGKLGADAF